ncbi:DJ-1/PfpI family protein [Carnobacterium divergens]|uniref:Glutamine amidotransferase n=1 Tax=Carnobacterium divergens TaxID=2748 RepID=A0A7Z8D0M7_CARDV|nr:DJ-1/PfpI family protein [Carnobacterium divergens]TFI75862.1 glutamine amidotransferase [Carnobacterium divergens]TFI79798.1 glutamine amidotransferase [Carnobacterium divergens]TFI86058.1 glutamine amidotransferase [Carnobacterium divergens]TFI98637.1 glutamine amidotransferase [Carnobacterium divergens]TFJ14795.1 glutamine amidotransferase [Carnobacterium divergens]
MVTVYSYVLDTLADWELGYVTSELNSGRFFKEGEQRLSLRMVSYSKETIHTMGGIAIEPNYLIENIEVSETTVLLLPGAETWSDPKHGAIIEKAKELLQIGGTVCAICGATAALANAGILNDRPHTSNGLGFLEMVSHGYSGQEFYIESPSVVDNNLITASSTGALLWTKQIIEHLGVFQSSTLEFWYDYFSTGDPKYYFALMETLPVNHEN